LPQTKKPHPTSRPKPNQLDARGDLHGKVWIRTMSAMLLTLRPDINLDRECTRSCYDLYPNLEDVPRSAQLFRRQDRSHRGSHATTNMTPEHDSHRRGRLSAIPADPAMNPAWLSRNKRCDG